MDGLVCACVLCACIVCVCVCVCSCACVRKEVLGYLRTVVMFWSLWAHTNTKRTKHTYKGGRLSFRRKPGAKGKERRKLPTSAVLGTGLSVCASCTRRWARIGRARPPHSSLPLWAVRRARKKACLRPHRPLGVCVCAYAIVGLCVRRVYVSVSSACVCVSTRPTPAVLRVGLSVCASYGRR